MPHPAEAPAALTDPARLEAVRATGLFHPETEEAFDRLARVARRALGGAFSLVSLVGADRQVVKGRAGSDLDETAVVDGVCRHTVAAGAPVVIPDALEDDRVCDLEAVTGGGLRAYLGVPLQMPVGEVVGSFMVGGAEPRDWTPDDVQTLRDLAAAVVAEIAARAALRASGQARFRALFDGVSQLTGLLAHDGAVLEANRTALDFAGLDRAGVVGQALWDALPLPPDMEARHREALGRAAAGEPVRYEETVWDRSGRERVLDVRLTPAPGEPGLLLLEGRDVTEAARLRRVQSAMMVGQAGTWELDVASGRVTSHGGVVPLFGLEGEGPHNIEAYLGRVHPDDADRVRRVVAASIESGADHSVEYRAVGDGGDVRWVRSRGVVLADDDGTPTRMIGALADVTDRRLEADAAARTAAELQVALDAAQMGRWEADLEADAVVQDARARALHGRPPGAGPAPNDQAMLTVHPDDRGRLGAAYRAVAERGGRFDAEYRTLRPDGPARWVRATGEVVGARLVGVVRDVTAEREAGDALRESEARFRRLADAAPALLWVTDPGGARTFLSRSWYEYTGQTEPDALGFGWLEAVHPDDADRARDLFLTANGAGEPFRLEYRLRRHDGVYRWAIDAARPLRDGDGAFAGFVGSVLDVDDRVAAEAALRESEERYRTLFESVEVGFCVVEVVYDGGAAVDYRFVETNPAFVAQTGLEDAVGRTIMDLVPGFDRHWVDLYAAVVETGAPVRYEDEAAAMGRSFEVYATRVGGPGSRRVAVLFTNVTERRAAERALRLRDEHKAVLLRLLTDQRDEPDPDEILAAGAETLGRHLGAHRAGFFEVRGGDALDFGTGPSWTDGTLPPLTGRVPATALGTGYLAEVRAGHARALEDVATDPLTAGSALPALGVRSEIGVPIMRGGRWVAGLYVDHAAPRRWTPADLEVARDVAEQTWSAVERARAGAAVRESEARVRLATEAAGLGLWSWLPDGDRITWENARVYEIFGFAPTDPPVNAARFASEVVHADDAPAFAEAVAATLERGVPFRFAGRFARADGALRWIEFAGRPVLDADGPVRQILGTAADVTEQKEAERALRESEARFRGTFENAAVGIAHVGLDGAWLDVNERLCEIVGYGHDELLERTFQDVTHPDDLGTDMALFERLLEGEIGHYQLEKRYVHRDGHAVWINLTVAPNWRADDRVDYAIAVVEDVGEKKAAEAALVRLNRTLESRVESRTAELERSNAELDQFAYVASHDLKAPLRAIDSLAAWIEEDAGAALPAESARHLALLRQRADRMEGLLDSLLTYSRAGRKEAAPERVDLGAVVREAVALVAPPDGVRVGLEGAFPALTTPRAPLELVVRNLVGNAIKHHDRPDGRVTVSARTVRRAGRAWAEVSVQDDGPGIAPEYQDRVFGMFQTLRPRDEVEGSGMGLAIVKKTVEARGGRVSVASEGRGAMFRFTWPLETD